MSTVGEPPPQPLDPQDGFRTQPRFGLRLYCAVSRPGCGKHMAGQPTERSQGAWRIGSLMPSDIASVAAGDDVFLKLREAHGRLPARGRPTLRHVHEAARAGWLATILVAGRRYTTVAAVRAAFGLPAPGSDGAPSPGGRGQAAPFTPDARFADASGSRSVQADRA